MQAEIRNARPALGARPGRKESDLHTGEYHSQPVGSTALLCAAAELRLLSKFEFLVGESSDALLLAQLAVDLLRLASGGSLRCTATCRAFAVAFPHQFEKEVGYGDLR